MIQSTIESRKQSRKGRAPKIDRKREDGALTLERDYWGDTTIYDEEGFRRRFRMSRRLIDRILKDLMDHDEYFMSFAMRYSAYGTSDNSLDGVIEMHEKTVLNTLRRFCKIIIHLYSVKYLRTPDLDYLKQILQASEERERPGILGNID